jgi:hypothetical protein
MLKPKGLLLLLILIFSCAWLSSFRCWKQAKARIGTIPKEHKRSPGYKEKMKANATEARIFIEKARYNESICFLVDMSLPSGQNRFFVYDLEKDSLALSGLVTHGNCNQYWLDGRKYDNVVGCGCTSLGKYKIGNSYAGRFGLAFKLYGLDKTNDKAFARYVVLHSHSCVPETEVKDEICQSNGCPTVAPGFLQQLKPIIDRSPKPILLWVFE